MKKKGTSKRNGKARCIPLIEECQCRGGGGILMGEGKRSTSNLQLMHALSGEKRPFHYGKKKMAIITASGGVRLRRITSTEMKKLSNE